MDVQTINAADTAAPMSLFNFEDGVEENSETDWVPLGCCCYSFWKIQCEPTLVSDTDS